VEETVTTVTTVTRPGGRGNGVPRLARRPRADKPSRGGGEGRTRLPFGSPVGSLYVRLISPTGQHGSPKQTPRLQEVPQRGTHEYVGVPHLEVVQADPPPATSGMPPTTRQGTTGGPRTGPPATRPMPVRTPQDVRRRALRQHAIVLRPYDRQRRMSRLVPERPGRIPR
jgi:hypothetical protein